MAHKPNVGRRVKNSADPQVEAMVSNPAEYFARARASARLEAQNYVRAREQHARPA